MSSEDIRRFKKFAQYVSVQMPTLRSNQTILNAIKKFSGKTSIATIKCGLEWNRSPKIIITPNLMCGGVKALGCHAMFTNNIEIDEAVVQEFEDGNGLRCTANGKLVYLAGVTLLHELTHWADGRDGVDDAVPGDPSNEEGEAFEKAVYGGIVNKGDAHTC